MRFEKHPSCASRVRIVRNVHTVIYAVGAAMSRTSSSQPSPVQFAGSHHLYASGWLHINDRRAVTANDSTLRPLHGSVGDKPTKLIAPARGRWCDFLRRPPSLPSIDALGDLTKATKSMNIASLSFSHPFHSFYFLMHVQERAEILSPRRRKKHDSLQARIRRLLGRFAYLTLLISFRASGNLFGAREHERARQRAATVVAKIPTRILHNTYFMRDAARGNSE